VLIGVDIAKRQLVAKSRLIPRYLAPMMIESGEAEPKYNARASDHESMTRQSEQEAAKEPLPPWVVVVLFVCVVFTLLWIAWLLSLVL
jgi:hypothetical protein